MAQKIIIPEYNEDKVVGGGGTAGSTGEDTYSECRGDELYAVHEIKWLS